MQTTTLSFGADVTHNLWRSTYQAVDLKNLFHEHKRYLDKLKSILTPEQLNKAELT